MAYMGEQCPRCNSTEGFVRRERHGIQMCLDGQSYDITRPKKIPVCRSCGRWSDRKDIKKIFSF